MIISEHIYQDAIDEQNHELRLTEGWHYCETHNHYWWYGVECEFCDQEYPCGECGYPEKEKLTQDAFKCLDPHCQAINIYNQSTRTFEVAVDSLGQIQRFCSGCKRTLEHSDEKTAGECRKCQGDLG